MINHLPPLGPLSSFCAAARHESFTKAAQELNLTHGAVSRAVKQLEDHFGCQLFQRRNRRLYLTEKGRFFAEKATSLLTELAQISEQMRAPPAESCLAISCEPSLAMRWLMPRLSCYNQQHNTDIQLATAGGPVNLAAQNLDIAIRRSDFIWPEDYWVTSLGRESTGPVCHPAYWDQLGEKPATLLHSRTRPAAWADWQEISGQQITVVTEHYFDHFYFSLQAAVAGLGIAIGPQPLVADDIRQGHLIAPYGFTETSAEYVALTLRNPQRDQRLSEFISWLSSELSRRLTVENQLSDKK